MLLEREEYGTVNILVKTYRKSLLSGLIKFYEIFLNTLPTTNTMYSYEALQKLR